MTDINIFENYASKEFDVCLQNEAALNTTADLKYVKYGQSEIDDYVASVSKPELSNYVNDQKQVIDVETTQSITAINTTVQEGIDNINAVIEEYDQSYITLDTEQVVTGDKTFEGTLQAVTPAPDDLSPNVATTAFVNGGNIISQGTNHIKFAGGLILQWGTIEISDSAGEICMFEIPFTTTAYGISLTHATSSVSPITYSTASVLSHSLSGFTLGSNDLGTWHWLAVGF